MVTFPEHVKSHTRQQISCFGPDGPLGRHDFNIDVIGGATGLLYATELPRRRWHHHPVHATGLRDWQGDYPLVPEPLLVAVELRATR